MRSILIITDDPQSSRSFAREICGVSPYEIRDLKDTGSPVGRASALFVDVRDLSPDATKRLRQVLGEVRRGIPLYVLFHQDTQQARLMAVALGATRTFSCPFDMAQLREIVSASHAVPQPSYLERVSPASLCNAVRTSVEVLGFFVTTFVPNRPIRPCVVDTGTNLIREAIRDVGIRDWISAVQRFDDATHQHCLLVAGLAAAFAKSIGLGDGECQRLTNAALLHDVGKIHVPAAILNKPGKLSDAETAVVRLHPEMGFRMLAEHGFSEETLMVVRSHHEMLDGSGYPNGLNAAEIPDLVRVVTVCDIYAALIERRTYRAPMTGETAITTLKGMVRQLDISIVAAFQKFIVASTASEEFKFS